MPCHSKKHLRGGVFSAHRFLTSFLGLGSLLFGLPLGLFAFFAFFGLLLFGLPRGLPVFFHVPPPPDGLSFLRLQMVHLSSASKVWQATKIFDSGVPHLFRPPKRDGFFCTAFRTPFVACGRRERKHSCEGGSFQLRSQASRAVRWRFSVFGAFKGVQGV